MANRGLKKLILSISFASVALIYPGVAHALYTQSDVEKALPDGVDSAILWDQKCYDYMKHYSGSSYSLRTLINGQAPVWTDNTGTVADGYTIDGASYVDTTWLSKQGSPNIKSPIDVPYSATSTPINLQINSVTFLCGTLVNAPGTGDHGWADNNPQDSSVIPNLLNDSDRWANKYTDGKDEPPNAIGSNNLHPARTGSHDKIVSLAVDASPTGTSVPPCTGTIGQGPVNKTQDIVRNNNHRYWFDPTPKNTTFTADSITTDCRLTITMDYQHIADYNGVLICQHVDKNGNTVDQYPSNTSDYAGCKKYTRTLRIKFNVTNMPSFAMDGVKIDNSGTGGYSGNCWSATYTASTQCPGSLSSYPFSDNTVTISGGPSGTDTDTADPFFYNGSSRTYLSGNYTLSVANESGYDTSYAICNSDTTTCDQAYYANNANYTAGNSVTRGFGNTSLGGVHGHYHVRFKFTKANQPPVFNSIAATCTAITGSVSDPDSPGTALSINATYTYGGTPYSTPGTANPNFSIPTSAAVQNGLDNATITVTVTANDANKAGVTSAATTTIQEPCGHVSCNSSTTPTFVEPGGTFATLTVTIFSSGAPLPPNQTFTLNYGGALGSFSGATSASPGSSYSQTWNNVPAGGVAQDYSGTLNSSSAALNNQPCGTVRVVDLPYFNVFGSDISAGGSFGCSTSGGILGGWYNNGNALAGGASTQFGATALGKILGVASARTSGAGPPTGLTFANTDLTAISTNANSPNLGGNFSTTTQHCLYLPKITAGAAEAAPATVNTLPNGVHPITGNINGLSGGSALTNSQNIVVTATGDVYINGNITYGSGWDKDHVPSFMLKANNIWISKDVTQLDGIYVASGNIYTCATGIGAKVSATNLFGLCSKQLIVRGSFIANQVRLMRTLGSLKDANSTESSATRAGCSNVGGGSSTDSCAAEVFEFSPEMYLGGWNLQQSGLGAVQYDAISALPPVL